MGFFTKSNKTIAPKRPSLSNLAKNIPKVKNNNNNNDNIYSFVKNNKYTIRNVMLDPRTKKYVTVYLTPKGVNNITRARQNNEEQRNMMKYASNVSKTMRRN